MFLTGRFGSQPGRAARASATDANGETEIVGAAGSYTAHVRFAATKRMVLPDIELVAGISVENPLVLRLPTEWDRK